MTTTTIRYSVDRVGDEEWAIFDEEKKGTPVVYMLYVIKVAGMLNHQVILTSYDAVVSAAVMVPIWDVELYSAFFYSIPEGVETMIHNIIEVLLDTDIENPVELAHAFGGTIRSEPVVQATHSSAH